MVGGHGQAPVDLWAEPFKAPFGALEAALPAELQGPRFKSAGIVPAAKYRIKSEFSDWAHTCTTTSPNMGDDETVVNTGGGDNLDTILASNEHDFGLLGLSCAHDPLCALNLNCRHLGRQAPPTPAASKETTQASLLTVVELSDPVFGGGLRSVSPFENFCGLVPDACHSTPPLWIQAPGPTPLCYDGFETGAHVQGAHSPPLVVAGDRMNTPQVVPGTILCKAAAELAGVQMFPW